MSHLGSGCPYPWDQCKCDQPAADQVVRRADGSIIPEPADPIRLHSCGRFHRPSEPCPHNGRSAP